MAGAVALVALSVVLLDGKRFEPDTPFLCPDAKAGDLRDQGGARDAVGDEIMRARGGDSADQPCQVPLADLPPLDPARIRAIAGVVGMKLPDEEWTQAGTPKVAALGQLLPFVPTAEEAARFKRGA